MAIYWILLFTPSFFSAFMRRKTLAAGIVFFALFILFVVVVGLRDTVGTDWLNYVRIYESMMTSGSTLGEFGHEPAFYVINLFARETSLGIHFVNLAHAAVFLGGLFYFCYKRCPDRFLALAIATPYLIIVVGMSGIRQAAAIGVVMFTIAIWHQSTNLTRIALLAAASAFHTSAILLAVLVLLDGARRPVRWFFVGVVALVAGLFILGPTQDYYVNSYVQHNLESPGAVYHSLLVVIPSAIYVLFRRRFAARGLYDPILFKMAAIALVVFPLLAISSTGLDRFYLYFTPVQLFVLSSIGLLTSPVLARLAMLLMNSAILFIWLEFANNSINWHAYSSCLVSVAGCFN
jgi:hypothetical protein